jgi:hypothetical protein
MKNKLLLTSALAGSLMFSGISLAQTTISGNLDISYKGVSSDGTIANTGNRLAESYIGKESQINIANKGKLSNGLDYAAGFSLEYDGNDGTDAPNSQQSFSNTHNENVYIDFISGNTTFTVGVDHIQNSDRTLGVLIGEDAEDFADGINQTNAGLSISAVGSDPASTYGAGIMQKTPIGTLSAFYTPKSGNRNQEVTSNDGIAFIPGITTDGSFTGTQSAFELGFVGDLGVKGLSTHLFYNKREALTTTAGDQDVKGMNIGASYNVGQFTAGINRKVVDQATVGTEDKQMEYSVAYAVNKELSVALNYSKAERDAVTPVATDEKVKSIAVGYNMGPVVLVGQYGKVDGKEGSVATSAEGDVLYLQLSTKF